MDLDKLAPGIAEGITEGVSKEEVMEEMAAEPSPLDGAERIAHLAKDRRVERVPLPAFVGEDHPSDLLVTFADGRTFRDVNKTFRPEVHEAMKAGMICLRCLEPQPTAFADEHLPGCEGVALAGPRYMRDRQIIDMAVEFEGEKHLGPSRPISAYLDEMRAEREKALFDRKLAEGASPMKGLRRA